jgi:hypothetical protein
MDGCSVDVVSGTACTLCRVQDLDVGAAVLAHSLGVMTRKKNWLRGTACRTDTSLTRATASGGEKSSRLVG